MGGEGRAGVGGEWRAGGREDRVISVVSHVCVHKEHGYLQLELLYTASNIHAIQEFVISRV